MRLLDGKKRLALIEWRQFAENGLEQSGKPEGKLTSMTVGIFDGVHLGHQALIKRIVSYNENYTPVIVTFKKNHKTETRKFQPEEQPGLNNEQKDILTFPEKLAAFESLGIQTVIAIDFTEEFRRMPGIEFLEILLKRGNIGFFATGSDFRCGCRHDTNADTAQSFFASRGIPAEITPQVMEGHLPVSSSRIRSAIALGDTALAKAMLGKSVPLSLYQ